MLVATNFRGPIKKDAPVDQNSTKSPKISKQNQDNYQQTTARRPNILPVKKVSCIDKSLKEEKYYGRGY